MPYTDFILPHSFRSAFATMTRVLVLFICLLALAAPLPAAPPGANSEQVRFFEAKVRPLLLAHCVECHGPKKRQGGLRLDSAAGLQDGGDSGAVVVPGQPDKSLLLRAVRHEGPKMPPKKQLAGADIAALADWIRMGAPWPAITVPTRPGREITAQDRAFWSFQPVRDPAVPSVKDSAWPQSALDRFILARLEAMGLSPSG